MIQIETTRIVFDGRALSTADLARGECDVRYACRCPDGTERSCDPPYGFFDALELTEPRCVCECNGDVRPCTLVPPSAEHADLLAAIDWIRAQGPGAKSLAPDDVERGIRAWMSRYPTSAS